MPLPQLLQRIVDYLRAGYPEGVPQHDYIPLFALVGQRLATEDVSRVADEMTTRALAPSGVDPSRAVAEALAALAEGTLDDGELARVKTRLESVGWSLDVTDTRST